MNSGRLAEGCVGSCPGSFDPSTPGCAECYAALSRSSSQHYSWIERHWCGDPVSRSANRVLCLDGDGACGYGRQLGDVFCCNTEPLESTDRLSSEPADLDDILHAASLSLGRPRSTAALLLFLLQIEAS